MKYFLSALLALTLFSCSKTEKTEQPFDSFVYSFTALHQDYMVKINNSDTLYFWKRFPKPETIGYAIMKESQRDSIVALVSKIDFTKYKSEYTEENISDAGGLKFDLVKNDKLKSINIYGGTAPKELYDHAVKFNEIIKYLNFQPYNGKVDFGTPIRPILTDTTIN
jgi:hypothetical protein